ncbi:hypothetical protein PS838_05008 [Pseudomonas fluorescens]|nr:hypothetical protein PS838_05008 [Pseudomonas fluorescens]
MPNLNAPSSTTADTSEIALQAAYSASYAVEVDVQAPKPLNR